MECQYLNSVLSNLFGYHLLQAGVMADEDLLAASRISHRVILDKNLDDGVRDDLKKRGVYGIPEMLPVASDTLDVLVLPHTLEFSEDPHQVLREAGRALIAEGHLVILGFNPWSLWMLWHLVLGWRGQPPWCGYFYSSSRIKDWLSLLGFDIIYHRNYFFRPPLQHDGVMNKLRFIETLGNRFWPILGAGYVLVAKKRVAALTPIRPRWRPRRSFVQTGVAEPQNMKYG